MIQKKNKEISGSRLTSHIISSQIRAASAAFATILSNPGNKRSISYSNFDHNEKRTFHILSERRRRHDLKKLFETLRVNIPCLDQKEKASKLTILKTAVDHLNFITNSNEQLKRVFQRETLKQKQLMQYLRTLETEAFLNSMYSNNNTAEQDEDDNMHNIFNGII